MKRIIIVLLAALPLLGMSAAVTDNGCCSKKAAAGKCTGSVACKACKNCIGCKHCTSGGTCGVCAGGKPKKTKGSSYGTSPASSSQCQAITKKGGQCSRKVRSGGIAAAWRMNAENFQMLDNHYYIKIQNKGYFYFPIFIWKFKD